MKSHCSMYSFSMPFSMSYLAYMVIRSNHPVVLYSAFLDCVRNRRNESHESRSGSNERKKPGYMPVNFDWLQVR